MSEPPDTLHEIQCLTNLGIDHGLAWRWHHTKHVMTISTNFALWVSQKPYKNSVFEKSFDELLTCVQME